MIVDCKYSVRPSVCYTLGTKIVSLPEGKNGDIFVKGAILVMDGYDMG